MRLWLTLVLWLGSSLVLTEESPPPSKRHKCPDGSPSKHVLCYHRGEVSVAALDPCLCTHLVLPSTETKDGYRLDTEKVGSSYVSDLRGAGNPSLRLLLGVDATSRALHGAPVQRVSDFARSTADYVKSARLDGLEVDLGDIADDSTHARRKEGVVSLFKALREEMTDASPGGDSDGDRDLLLRLPVRPEALAKTYDLKPLSKYVDYFTVSTHNITDASEKDVTYHHSRLMGLADILNTDSVLDLLTGMGAPLSKLIISLPTEALSFSLKDERDNVARSPVAGPPKTINYEQVCAMIKEGGWTVERDEDLTAPYAFRNKTWIAFEDETSVTIKGKYALLRGLAGVAVSSLDADDSAGICGKGPFPLTRALRNTITKLSRKPRGLVLQSLEEELRGGETVALPEASLGAAVRLSPFRIVRVVDREGAVHVVRRNSETSFQCSRQGYFRHPLGCNQFYRCVKFDQLVDDFSVFEYDCPPGLAFDEKWEVCVWPGQMSRPCDGSSEIAPVPRARFTCPAEGYYADPENCRWFFACLDHHGDPSVAGRDATNPHSGLTAYEFRCPFGLAFDGSRLACEWPWLVPGCGRVEIGSGVLAAVQPARLGYGLVGGSGSIAASSAVHHVSNSDSGTVASIVGAGGVGSGARLVSGASHIGGISHDLHSLGGEGYGHGGAVGVIASGGSLIGLGGIRLGYGAGQQASFGTGAISEGSHFGAAQRASVDSGVITQGSHFGGAQLASFGTGGTSEGSHFGAAQRASVAPGVVTQGSHFGGAQLVSFGTGGPSEGSHFGAAQRTSIDSGVISQGLKFGGAQQSLADSGIISHGSHFGPAQQTSGDSGIISQGSLFGGARQVSVDSGIIPHGSLFGGAQQPSADSGIISQDSHFLTGGLNLQLGNPQTVSLGGTRFGNAYSNQQHVASYEPAVPAVTAAPAVPDVSAVPAVGLSYVSRPSIVTGYENNLKTVHAQDPLRLIGVSGVGRGVSVTNVGLSGIGSGGVGLYSATTLAPLEVGLVTERPLGHVHSTFDDASKYTVSVSTAAPTSRPLSLVRTNVYSSPAYSVTPTPITYQSPRPTFLPQNTYHNPVPAVSSATSSFSFSRNSQPDVHLNTGSAFGLGYPSGSEASDTRSGSAKFLSRPLTSYRSDTYTPQTYSSAAVPTSVSTYSIDASPPRTGGLVPVRPIESSSIFSSSERPLVEVESFPALDAARAAAAASSDGGSVGNALHQGSPASLREDGAPSNTYDVVGLGQIRDDEHAVTGDGSSRPSLVGISSGSQEPLSPIVSVPESRFSYKNLPLSIIDAASPVRSYSPAVGTSSTFFHQSPPQRVYTTTNVSPAPTLLHTIDGRNHQNTISTYSTTPDYENLQVNVNDGRSDDGFSYKHILPIQEFSTPAPVVSRVSLEDVSIGNRESYNVKTVRPVFTTTEAPPVSVSVDDKNYGSRIFYEGHNEQPVAYTSSRGSSGLIQSVQPVHHIAVPYNPSFHDSVLIKEHYIPQVKSTPSITFSTTPQPPSTISTLSYSTASVPIPHEPTVFLTPSRGSTRHRFYPSTTIAPILANAYPTEQQLVDDISAIQINRVTQNAPISTTFAPPIFTPSVLPVVSVKNQSSYGFRSLGIVPTFQPTIQLGRDSSSSSDKDGPVSVSADVKASYGDRPSKRVKVDVVLKEDDDEPHISIETDSGKVGRGRYRYRARGGKVQVNGKKKCDDEEVQNVGQDYPNVDALLDTYSGNFGSVLNNGERGIFSPINSDNKDYGQAVEVGNSGSDNYEPAIQRGDQGSRDDGNRAFGFRNRDSKPQLALGVSVNSGLRNVRPRLRGRFKPSSIHSESGYSSSTAQYIGQGEEEINAYTVSSLPTVSPIPSSTIAYRRGSIQRNDHSDISSIYTGNVAKGNAAETGDGSSIDLSHAAVIILPCGKLPALLAKLGAVSESLKSIEKEEINAAALKVAGKQVGASLSLPPLNKYGPNGWDSVEKTLGNNACQRAGLFRHPQDCNRFYECFWDEWKGRYSLHEFKCPIRLAYDDSLSACNWPTTGPACSGNKLLV